MSQIEGKMFPGFGAWAKGLNVAGLYSSQEVASAASDFQVETLVSVD